MQWITRERPKIDRIACPWLIARFIDKALGFLYVPSKDVLMIAEETGRYLMTFLAWNLLMWASFVVSMRSSKNTT